MPNNAFEYSMQANLPAFSQLVVSEINPQLDKILHNNQQAIDAILQQTAELDNGSYSWDNLVAPIEQLNDQLSNFWSPVSHLNAVCNTDELRLAYNEAQPKLSAYYTKIGQNHALYSAYKQLANDSLNAHQQKVISNALRDFELSGVALTTDKKKKFASIKLRTTQLSNKFSENVLDSTQAWQKHITDVTELAGMPELALAAAQQAAKEKDLDGYLLTLEFPSYLPVMTYCDNRELRLEVYTAFATRASNTQANQQWDNSPIIAELLDLRHEQAEILGFASYAHYSLATKMANTAEDVLGFLHELASHSVDTARAEFASLSEYAEHESGLKSLRGIKAWDIAYFSEKLKLEKFAISDEQLRPYFPMNKVLAGLFEITSRLFNFDIRQVEQFDTWHPDVSLYEISRDQQIIARFYLDPFARANKRGGAWMDVCRNRRIDSDGNLQLPTAYLVCNFNAPVGSDPALLTHNELTTLFHEFGHGLHHMMSKVEYADISGINGVPWDAVELPSQFLENWCWQPQALAIISGHYLSGETLPPKMLEQLIAAKNFQSAMTMVRQLEFSIFDYRLHLEHNIAASQAASRVQPLLDEIRQQVAAIAAPAFNVFQNSFSHIFAGGYAAGYYSYKWAEVLSADAYSLFESKGIFHRETGQLFLNCILEKGGSAEPLQLFVDFRGREPNTEALLRHSGIDS